MKKYLNCIVWTILLVGFDQLTKYLAVLFLKGKDGIDIITNVFKLYYLENKGAAFGILKDKQWLFFIITIVFLLLVIYAYIKVPYTKKYFLFRINLILVISGAIGNLIDRILNKYVIDFIYFELIDFPIFNIADCYVTISAILFLILILFYYKDEDFIFLKLKGEQNG